MNGSSQYPVAHRQGFTLIELSIVLVIVGLIVGGVLVGQDLIKAAEVRATVSQIQSYKVAMNTFQGKYNCLPGDCTPAQAAAFGFATRTGATGRGDGDGLIIDGVYNGAQASGEVVLFWNDLSAAHLVGPTYHGIDCDDGACLTSVEGYGGDYTIAEFVPLAKIGRGIYLSVYAKNGINYIQTLAITGIASNGGFDGDGALVLTPQQAFEFDSRLDDGLPNSGSTLSTHFNAMTPNAGPEGAASDGLCGNTDTTPTSYNTTPAYATGHHLCAISVRMY